MLFSTDKAIALMGWGFFFRAGGRYKHTDATASEEHERERQSKTDCVSAGEGRRRGGINQTGWSERWSSPFLCADGPCLESLERERRRENASKASEDCKRGPVRGCD